MPRLARACFDARHGVAKIVVLLQRGADQVLQFVVLETSNHLRSASDAACGGGQRIRRAEMSRASATLGAE